MKQLLTAGVIALGIHCLLLIMDFKWPESRSFERPKSRVLNMTLTSLPMKETPRPDPQLPKPVFKESTIAKKTIRTDRKRVVTPSSQKKVQIPNQTTTSDIVGKTSEKPEQTIETTEAGSEPEQISTKEFSKKTEQYAPTPSSTYVIHEARPIYRSNPPPEYPRIARIRGYQGDVMLDVLVNKDGRVHDLKIHRSSGHPILDRSAISTVKHWLFEPGMVGEEKVNMWVRVPIRFELK